MDLAKTLSDWYSEQNIWVKVATKQLINNGIKIEELCIEDIIKICIDDAIESNNEHDTNIDWNSILVSTESPKLQIAKLYDIKNINALKIDAEISFGNTNLTIIYGKNGAGKTGFTRILKKLAYPNKHIDVLPNTYIDTVGLSQQFSISYSTDGVTCNETMTIESGQKFIGPYNQIEIFDEEQSRGFINQKSNISYKPYIIDVLVELAKVFEAVSGKLQEKLNCIQIPVPSTCNAIIENSRAFIEYVNLNHETKIESLGFTWDKEKQSTLDQKEKELKAGISAKINNLENQNKKLDIIIKEFRQLSISYCDRNCKTIEELKTKVTLAQANTAQASKVLSNDANVDGIGSELWKELWESAKQFFEKEAYKESSFPPKKGQFCVLCNQPVDSPTESKMKEFNDYILSDSNNKYLQAKKKLKDKQEALQNIQKDDYYYILLEQCSLQKSLMEDILKELTQIKCLRPLLLSSDKNYLNDSKVGATMTSLDVLLEKNTTEIQELKSQNPDEYDKSLREQIFELESHKWFHENIETMKNIVEAKKQQYIINTAIDTTKTSFLSRKIAQISKELFTQSYVDNFIKELNLLKAFHINVELKPSITKGVNQTQLVINSKNNDKAEKILSEGEKRIVSLAGFIVDVNSTNTNSPIIFDDPISSLDIDYEDAFIDRIVNLANTRQIIVFTHRLAFFNELCEKSKSSNLTITDCELYKFQNCSGYVTTNQNLGKNTKGRLNSLKNDTLAKAKKLLQNGHKRESDEKIQVACKEIRIVIENIIEHNLLGGIVRRYNKVMRSKLVKNLFKIDQQDCESIDNLMSKYSFSEHSQSEEKPHCPLSIEEIDGDIEKLKVIIEKYNQIYR